MRAALFGEYNWQVPDSSRADKGCIYDRGVWDPSYTWTPEFASSPNQRRRIAQGCVTGVRHGDSSSAHLQQTRLSPQLKIGWVILEQ
jgi:hypothetical protein